MSGASLPAGGNGDRPVLVLGARSDMAMGIVRVLAGRGHPLMLAARDPSLLERDRADLAERFGVDVTLHRYDAEVPAEDMEAGAAGLLAALPHPPRIALSAVGLLGEQDRTIADPALIRRVITTNFTGPAMALEMAAAQMHATGLPCAIIGIGSVAGDRGRAKNYVYGAAKAGFAEWLSGMRQKYARSAVHVLTVKPGFVATAMTEGMDLPGPLVATVEETAQGVVRALDRGVQVHYALKWLAVMSVIKMLPEKIFMKTKF